MHSCSTGLLGDLRRMTARRTGPYPSAPHTMLCARFESSGRTFMNIESSLSSRIDIFSSRYMKHLIQLLDMNGLDLEDLEDLEDLDFDDDLEAFCFFS